MATPPRCSPLSTEDLQITDGPVAGPGLKEAFRRLFAILNGFFDGLNKLFSKGITVSENLRCDVISGTFSHGVEQQVQLKTLTRAGSAIPLGGDGQVPLAVSVKMVQQTSQPKPLATVIVWFNDPAAANVKCTLWLLPEGQQTATKPVWI